jgi:hypothetical protein
VQFLQPVFKDLFEDVEVELLYSCKFIHGIPVRAVTDPCSSVPFNLSWLSRNARIPADYVQLLLLFSTCEYSVLLIEPSPPFPYNGHSETEHSKRRLLCLRSSPRKIPAAQCWRR